MNADPSAVVEPARLDAVRGLRLIDTPPEPGYDRLVRLATTVVDMPIAYVSLVDVDRCWYKSRVGLELSETAREGAFDLHTITQEHGELFVVEDTWVDDRFENHPLVSGSPRIRFYAGCPLRLPTGEAVGTLSVIDRQPRSLSTRERLALADVAALVEELLAHRVEPVETSDVPVTVELVDPDDPTVGLDPSVQLAWQHGLPQFGVDTARVAALETELEAARLMLDSTTDVIVVLDAEAQIKFASPSLERVLGHTSDYRHPEGALGFVHADDRHVARSRVTAVMAGAPGTEPFLIRVLTSTGSIRQVECTARSLFSTRSVGGVAITMRDVSDRHMLSQMLAFQSTHDRLTELPNRMLFQEHLSPALARARRDRRPVAVCYLDLTGFQDLNDQLGHEAGDELLVDVAKRIRSSIRTGDSAARLGGDEFAVLLDPVADAADAVVVAERIVAAISGPHSLQSGVSSCGAHAGVAIAADGDDATSIIARAARALAVAKRGVEGTVSVGAAPASL